MTVFDHTIRTIESVADEYVRTRTSNDEPIVMSRAIKSVRMILPGIGHCDDELASIIAMRAAESGLPVEFD